MRPSPSHPLSLCLQVHLLALAMAMAGRLRRSPAERGQSTVEYALVVLGVITIALLVLAWARSSNQIGRLFDAVFSNARERVQEEGTG